MAVSGMSDCWTRTWRAVHPVDAKDVMSSVKQSVFNGVGEVEVVDGRTPGTEDRAVEMAVWVWRRAWAAARRYVAMAGDGLSQVDEGLSPSLDSGGGGSGMSPCKSVEGDGRTGLDPTSGRQVNAL